MVAALAAIGFAYLTFDSVESFVSVSFAAFCLLDAGLVAINLRWANRALAIVPVLVAVCAAVLWFTLGMAQVSNSIAAIVALSWAFLLFLLTRYCSRSGAAA